MAAKTASKPKKKPAAVDMPALNVELLPVAELKPHPRNPNTHPDKQIEGLGGAYDEFGITSIVVVDENGQILAGEGRWTTAKKKGIAQIPGTVIKGWTEAKKLAFMFSDNQWAKLSVWNTQLLRGGVDKLKAAKFDLTLTGLHLDIGLAQELGIIAPDENERGRLLELVNITIADPTTVVERGDHYTLSDRHHLFCESVVTGWKTWAPLLKDDALFCPYPGVFVPFGEKGKKHVLVLVQGDPYIAGHILDRWKEAHGKKSVKKVNP